MPWKKGRPRGNPDEPKDDLKRPGPMLRPIVERVEKIAKRRGWTKRQAWERCALMAADLIDIEDGLIHLSQNPPPPH